MLSRSGNTTPTRRRSPSILDSDGPQLDFDIQPSADDDEVVSKLKARLRYLEAVVDRYKDLLRIQDDSVSPSGIHGIEGTGKNDAGKRYSCIENALLLLLLLRFI